jgi:hypothetical protein
MPGESRCRGHKLPWFAVAARRRLFSDPGVLKRPERGVHFGVTQSRDGPGAESD